MDAKIGDWVVAPRIGKPVEIKALWYNLLRTMAGFLAERDDPEAQRYHMLAERVRASFRTRFIHPERGYLADVVDGPEGDDWTIRPNQIFAASLPDPLLEGKEACKVVEAVGTALLTSYGLRSLAPEHVAYYGAYGGDPAQRDSSYHQGSVWTWLLGAYAEAHYRVYGDRDAALTLLLPIGEPPHLPRGCVAQAWGVAEVLRVWRQLEGRTGATAATAS